MRSVECLLVGAGGETSDDAIEQMQRLIAQRFGIDAIALAGADATSENVLDELDALVERGRGRGTLLATLFSGHGGVHGGVHAWQLHRGGYVTDEQLSDRIGSLHPDSEVFMVSDCCYGSGMLHLREGEDPADLPERLIAPQEQVRRRLHAFAARAAFLLREPDPLDPGRFDKGRLPIGHVVLAASTDWLLVRLSARRNDFVRALCQAVPRSPTYGALLGQMKEVVRNPGQANWLIDAEPDSALHRPILVR